MFVYTKFCVYLQRKQKKKTPIKNPDTMENKGISNRMRNLMQKYIGKKYAFNYHGSIIWTLTIGKLMGNTGYFVTEINDGKSTWISNASYGEITQGIKKGQYIEQ